MHVGFGGEPAVGPGQDVIEFAVLGVAAAAREATCLIPEADVAVEVGAGAVGVSTVVEVMTGIE